MVKPFLAILLFASFVGLSRFFYDSREPLPHSGQDQANTETKSVEPPTDTLPYPSPSNSLGSAVAYGGETAIATGHSIAIEQEDTGAEPSGAIQIGVFIDPNGVSYVSEGSVEVGEFLSPDDADIP